ncbi:MAG: ABC transporter substrate-binding protein, partial [Bifidobacterium tsurumiense]|nr:ABC transporter substrate-binding protein [Bifidobacterium tsurumiense]
MASEPSNPIQPTPNPSGFSKDEPVRVNHTARNTIIAVIVVAVLAVAVFFGYRAFAGKSDAAKGSESNPVKIGVVGATDPQWVAFEKKA